MLRVPLALVLLLFAWVARPAEAAQISELLFVRAQTPASIERIDFDGNQLIGSSSTVAAIAPIWNAMSWDQAAGTMYFVRTIAGVTLLEKIGFDGNQLIGSSATIQALSPGFDAMSYDPDSDILYFVRTIAGVTLLEKIAFDGNQIIGSSTTIQALAPGWEAMSYDPDSDTLFFVRTIAGVHLLEKIEFDGNALIGSSTTIQALSPSWDAMTLVFAEDPVGIPVPPAALLLGASLVALALVRHGRSTGTERR